MLPKPASKESGVALAVIGPPIAGVESASAFAALVMAANAPANRSPEIRMIVALLCPGPRSSGDVINSMRCSNRFHRKTIVKRRFVPTVVAVQHRFAQRAGNTLPLWAAYRLVPVMF